MARPDVKAYYDALHQGYGHRGWWPGDSPFEVCIGAILTQNTNWTNVEKAIDALRAASLMDALDIVATDQVRLAEIIRPSGYYNQKSKRLKIFAAWWIDSGGESGIGARSTERLREELLSLNGVGPETADSMLLYAFDRPVFVVDTYTWRVLHRHGLIPEETSYEEMQALFHGQLDSDAALFNDFHAQIVEVGKRHCGPRANCSGCPLEPFLPNR